MTIPPDALAVLSRMPAVQLNELTRLVRAHPGGAWHFADCGCCLCLHPPEGTDRGWLIGPDGTSEWREGVA